MQGGQFFRFLILILIFALIVLFFPAPNVMASLSLRSHFHRVINNAAPAFPGNFRNALESFDVNSDGLIDYPEFLAMERRFPMIMFPAFRLQDRLQKGSLGEWAVEL